MNPLARGSVVLGAIALFLLVIDDPNTSSFFSLGGLAVAGVGWLLSKAGVLSDDQWAAAGAILSGLAFVIYLAMVTEFLS